MSIKYPFKVSCKQASYLISKQQETNISFTEKIKLKIHLAVCDTCSLFKKQLHQIKILLTNKPRKAIFLSNEKKERIAKELEKEMNVR